MHCPDDTLINAPDKALGDRVDNISVADLLKEIEVLARQRQRNKVKSEHARHDDRQAGEG